MSNNRYQYCPRCGKRKMHAHHSQMKKTESSSSSTSSLVRVEVDNNRWLPEFLGTGSGTTSWKPPSHKREESSIKIIDHTTYSKRCWKRDRHTH